MVRRDDENMLVFQYVFFCHLKVESSLRTMYPANGLPELTRGKYVDSTEINGSNLYLYKYLTHIHSTCIHTMRVLQSIFTGRSFGQFICQR